jgi:hypothetical protein
MGMFVLDLLNYLVVAGMWLASLAIARSRNQIRKAMWSKKREILLDLVWWEHEHLSQIGEQAALGAVLCETLV